MMTHENEERQSRVGGVHAAYNKDGDKWFDQNPSAGSGRFIKASTKLGLFTIHVAGPFGLRDGSKIGANFAISYDGETEGYSKLEWFQTILTDNPTPGAGTFKINHRANSGTLYYSDPITMSRTENFFEEYGLKGGFKFTDFPTRPATDSYTGRQNYLLLV